MTLLNSLIASFQHDITRDLAWSVFAPSLLSAPEITLFCPELNDARIRWLQAFDRHQNDKKPDYRLGRYHEYLWACFLKEDYQYECIAQNIAIRNNGATLGELDFIILDKLNQRFIHLEVAVKFYLLHARADMINTTGNRNWLGPNSNDNLERKWRHITEKQIHLCRQPEAIETLRKYSIEPEKLDTAISLKGYVFSTHTEKKYPEFFNTANSVHTHCNIQQFSAHLYNGALLGVIPKHCWLTGIHQKNEINILEKECIIEHAMKASSPVMIATLKENKNSFEELTRFFLTPDSWP